MAATAQKTDNDNNRSTAKRSNGNTNATRRSRSTAQSDTPKRKTDGRFRKESGQAGWITAVVGVGVAVAAGLFATRKQWLPKAEEWRDDFAAAFADDETDYENFDQTRGAGADSMRDHPGDDWEDIDDMSDASFPASDPPSFTPGQA